MANGPTEELVQQLGDAGVLAKFVDHGDLAEALELTFASGRTFRVCGTDQWVGDASVYVDEVATQRER